MEDTNLDLYNLDLDNLFKTILSQADELDKLHLESGLSPITIGVSSSRFLSSLVRLMIDTGLPKKEGFPLSQEDLEYLEGKLRDLAALIIMSAIPDLGSTD